MSKFKFLGTALLAGLLVVSCKKDDTTPVDNHEHDESELITTVQLNFSGKGISGNDTTFTVSFDDPDGTGGNKPTSFDTIRFAANKTYTCDLILLDKSKNPVDTISNEVKEEADEHLFFFTPSNSDALSVTINDKDSKGRNLGLKTSWVTKKATNGTLKVKLMHQPGVKDGTSANGDTDVEIDFPLVIK
ncbi:MAG: hypothetical protein ACK48V_09425 [Crocinitomicaceae bacterium]|jgi:hypothetical protein